MAAERDTIRSAASVVLAAFESHAQRFAGITARARRHFERADWLAGQRDSSRRLDLYGECVVEAITGLRERLRTSPMPQNSSLGSTPTILSIRRTHEL